MTSKGDENGKKASVSTIGKTSSIITFFRHTLSSKLEYNGFKAALRKLHSKRNVSGYGYRQNFPPTLRRLISYKLMKVFGFRPCSMNQCFPELTSDNFVSHGKTTGSGEQKDKIQPGFKWGVRRNNGRKVKPKAFESLEKLEEIVKHVKILECHQNAEYLWAYFAKFLDRLFLYFHILLTIVVILFSMLY